MDMHLNVSFWRTPGTLNSLNKWVETHLFMMSQLYKMISGCVSYASKIRIDHEVKESILPEDLSIFLITGDYCISLWSTRQFRISIDFTNLLMYFILSISILHCWVYKQKPMYSTILLLLTPSTFSCPCPCTKAFKYCTT